MINRKVSFSKPEERGEPGQGKGRVEEHAKIVRLQWVFLRSGRIPDPSLLD